MPGPGLSGASGPIWDLRSHLLVPGWYSSLEAPFPKSLFRLHSGRNTRWADDVDSLVFGVRPSGSSRGLHRRGQGSGVTGGPLIKPGVFFEAWEGLSPSLVTFGELIQQADSLGVASFLVLSKSWPFCDDGRGWLVPRHTDLRLGQSWLPALRNGRPKLGELQGALKSGCPLIQEPWPRRRCLGTSESPAAICPP